MRSRLTIWSCVSQFQLMSFTWWAWSWRRSCQQLVSQSRCSARLAQTCWGWLHHVRLEATQASRSLTRSCCFSPNAPQWSRCLVDCDDRIEPLLDFLSMWFQFRPQSFLTPKSCSTFQTLPDCWSFFALLEARSGSKHSFKRSSSSRTRLLYQDCCAAGRSSWSFEAQENLARRLAPSSWLHSWSQTP